MAVSTFKTYNQAKQNQLFAHSLAAVADAEGKVALKLYDNTSASDPNVLSSVAIGRADTFNYTLTAPSGDDPSKVTLQMVDAAGNEIKSVTLENLVGTAFQQTLTNKTINLADGNGNTISNMTTASLADSAKATTISALASAVDTKLTTEKAVATALQNKVQTIQLNGTAITATAADDKIVNIPVASASALGVVKVDDNTIKVDADGVLTAQETITYSMASEDPSAAESADYVKIYHLTKTVGSADPVNVGQAIKIPRDFLVKDSKVVTAANYASGVAIEKYAILLHTETEGDVAYVFKEAATAAENTGWDAVSAKAEKITSISVAAGDKIIVFVVNNQQETAANKYLFIKVADLLTVYTAGNGLTLSADHQFSVVLTENGGLEFAGTEGSKTIGVKTDASTLEVSSDGKVQVKNAGIVTAKIADDAVTSAKLSDVDSAAGAAVATANIQDGAVTTDKIADSNVTTAKIADANVTADKLATDSVTTAKIVDGNVTTAKLADQAVTSAKLGSKADTGTAAVATTNIQDGAVTTAELGADAVTNAKLADDAVKIENVDNSLLCKLYEITEEDGVITFTQLEEKQS